MPARIFSRNQHRQLERVSESERREFPRRCLSDEQVPALERSPEDGARVALRGRRASSPGPERQVQPKALPSRGWEEGAGDELSQAQ
jgi:hypothetical protein